MQVAGLPSASFATYQPMVTWYLKQGGGKCQANSEIIAQARRDLSQASGLMQFKAFLAALAKDPVWSQPLPLTFLTHRGSEHLNVKPSLRRCDSRIAWETQIKPWIERWVVGNHQDDWVINGQGRPNERSVLYAHYVRVRGEAWLRFFQGMGVKQAKHILDSLGQLTDFLVPEGAWLHFMGWVAEEFEGDDAFKGFFAGFVAAGDAEAPENPYLRQLSALKGDWESLLWDADRETKSEAYLAQLFSEGREGENNLIQGLKALSAAERGHSGLAQAYLRCLKGPLISASASLIRDGSVRLQTEWQALAEQFEQNLSHRFPFEDTPEEVTLSEFARFFGPEQGCLSRFVDERLSPYLQHQGQTWVAKSWMGLRLPFSVPFLRQLRAVDRIRKGFFQGSSSKVAWVFQVLPKPSPHFSSFSLEANTDVHVYRNDPEEWKIMHWPGEGAFPSAKLNATSVNPPKKKTLAFQGEWALFRLLQAAHLRKLSEGNYLVYFQIPIDSVRGKTAEIEKEQVVFQIRMDASQDVLSLLAEKGGFRLVKNLYGS